MYNAKVLQHFQKPHNFGKMTNPDGVGKVGNVVCGDLLWLYIKVGKNKQGQEIIQDIKFETFGCVAAIATSSIVTDLAKDKKLLEAIKINKDKIIQSLGSLPPVKIHCSVLAADALAEAVYDYLKKNKRRIPADLAKRHQRISNEEKLVREKYKGWIDQEEKLHQ